MPRSTSVATPSAHLLGPGQLNVVNRRLVYAGIEGAPVQLDPRALSELFCYGKVSLSDEALHLLTKHRVEVILMSHCGTRFRGRLVQLDTSGTQLRMLQHQLLQNPATQLELARQVVDEKVQSQLDAARHYQRQGRAEAGKTHRQLRKLRQRVAHASTVEQLRGLEGSCTATWFELLARLLRHDSPFTRRQRRPPRDPVNALLSLGYTFLLNRVTVKIQARGLELNIGALHEYRPGRPSLACDLMEPLRLPLVDRWVISRWNQKVVTAGDFCTDQQRGCYLKEKRFAALLSNWEQHLEDGGHRGRIDDVVNAFCQRLRHLASDSDQTTGPQPQ